MVVVQWIDKIQKGVSEETCTGTMQSLTVLCLHATYIPVRSFAI
jgi:hypothetical protein